MVNLIDTEVFSSHSSASSDRGLEVIGISGCGEVHDTEPIDETIATDSSILESPFQMLYDDTELVDNGNFALDEVVNDSEDEDCGMGSGSAVESTSLLGGSPKAADIRLESDGSNDHECQTGKQESNCDTVSCFRSSSLNSHGPGLHILNSQEPGESTQAAALGFVDQFLMDKDLNLSPLIPETSWRMKSPPFSGAKGRQSLAKRIKTRSPTKKLGVFDWDSDQYEERENPVAYDDPGAKKGVDLSENRKVSSHPTQRFMQNSSAKHLETEQALVVAQLQDKVLEELSEPEEDYIDVGINTQIAAEAMSALLYAPCTNEDCESGPCSFKESNIDVVQGTARTLNTENVCSGREIKEHIASVMNIDHLKLASGLATSKKAKRSRSVTARKMNIGGSNHVSKSFTASSSNCIEHRNQMTVDTMSSRQSEIVHQNPFRPFLLSSLEKTLAERTFFSGQSTHSAPERVSEIRDQVCNLSRRNIDTIEGRLERDNWSGPICAPHKGRNSKKKRKNSMEKRTDTKDSAIECLPNLCEWKHPKAKRSPLTQRDHVPHWKSWGASSVKDSSGTNTLSNRLRISSRGTIQVTSCQSGVNDSDVANYAYIRKIYGGNHESPCSKDFPRPFLLKELTRPVEPGKIGDFTWKDLRRRRNLAHVRVLFSKNLDGETIKQQNKIMVQLGISPASSSAESTHFIADRFARTRNMLEAIALAKPVVTPLWLESCRETRCLIDEKNYILRDSKRGKDGFCLLTSLTRAKQHPLLKGLKVCITPNIKPSRGMIADLVKMTQGQVVETSEIIAAKNRNFLENLLILSCEDDRDFCLPFINQGAVIYTSELLLNGIVIQKLEYARHRLF